MTPDVVVLGGGLAGLSAAFRLQMSGWQTVVLEKSLWPGGRARSFCEDGLCVDLSAQFLASFYRRTMVLLDELGMSDLLSLIPDGTAVIRDEHTYSLTPFSLFFGSLLPVSSRLRLLRLMADVFLKASQIDVDDILKSLPLDTEPITRFAQQHLDNSLLQNLLAPLFRGFFYWNTDSTTLAMLYFLMRYAPAMKLYTLRGGIGRLAQVLAEHVPVESGHEVLRVVYDEGEGAWKTAVSHQNSVTTLTSKAILCTLPAVHINAIFPQLPPPVRQHFAQINYTTNTTAHLFFNQRFSLPPFAHLFYLPHQVPNLSAIVLQDNKDPLSYRQHHNIISVFPSSPFSQHLITQPDEQINQTILQQLKQYYPFKHANLQEAFLFSKIVRVHQALPRFTPGYIHALHRFETELKATLPPGLFFAGDYMETPSIEGAIVSSENVLPALKIFLSRL